MMHYCDHCSKIIENYGWYQVQIISPTGVLLGDAVDLHAECLTAWSMTDPGTEPNVDQTSQGV